MSKIVNILIEENTTFTKVLKFTHKVKTGETTNPLTGKPVAIWTTKPINLTGYNIEAHIVTSLNANAVEVAQFKCQLIDSPSGTAYIALTKAQTSSLDLKHGIVSPYRVYQLGYYDILMTDKEGYATRIMQGKCYFSRAATFDPRIINNSRNSVVNMSPITAVGTPTEVNADITHAHNYVGIRYFSGGVPTTPTAGKVDMYRMPATTSKYLPDAIGVLLSTYPSLELSWMSNTKKVRGVPSGIIGASHYQIVVVSNNS